MRINIIAKRKTPAVITIQIYLSAILTIDNAILSIEYFKTRFLLITTLSLISASICAKRTSK